VEVTGDLMLVFNSFPLLKLASAFVAAALQKVDNQMTCSSYLVAVPRRPTHSSNNLVVERR
jgi:hypothetical protein